MDHQGLAFISKAIFNSMKRVIAHAQFSFLSQVHSVYSCEMQRINLDVWLEQLWARLKLFTLNLEVKSMARERSKNREENQAIEPRRHGGFAGIPAWST